MLLTYRTLQGYGEETLIIKKSRFIGYAQGVASEEEAVAFVEGIRKRHWDATHNCFAYVIGEQDDVQRFSDDGEPSGTAGKPILEVIKKEQLKDTVVVVTRYFGGVLLGAGGLVRAYGQAAGVGIRAAGIVTRVLFGALVVDVEYGLYGKVEYEVLQAGAFVEQVEYADRVRVHVLVERAAQGALEARLVDVTSGQAVIEQGEPVYWSVRDGKLVR